MMPECKHAVPLDTDCPKCAPPEIESYKLQRHQIRLLESNAARLKLGIAELEKALNESIAANELVLAQLRGGADLSAEQVAKTLNAALDSARAALEGKR